MQSIAFISSDENEAGDTLYQVQFESGQALAGLTRADLASYPAFRLAAALQSNDGHVSAVEVCGLTQREGKWFEVLAAAIREGLRLDAEAKH